MKNNTQCQCQYMTTSEFAARIGIHPQTVRLWDKLGTLKAHHKTASGRRYYSEEQAQEFLNGNHAETPRETTI